jgi:hypothetical protein
MPDYCTQQAHSGQGQRPQDRRYLYRRAIMYGPTRNQALFWAQID